MSQEADLIQAFKELKAANKMTDNDIIEHASNIFSALEWDITDEVYDDNGNIDYEAWQQNDIQHLRKLILS